MQQTIETPDTDSTETTGEHFAEADLPAAVGAAVAEAVTLATVIDVQACARHLVTTLSPRQQYLLQEPLIMAATIVRAAEALGLVEVNQVSVLMRNQDDKVGAAKLNRFLRDLTPVAAEEPDADRDALGREIWEILSASDLALGPIGEEYDFATEQHREIARAVGEAVARFVLDQQGVV